MNLHTDDKLSPRAVIFDLGSTLIEYEPIPWDELSLLCAHEAHAFLNRSGVDIGEKDIFSQQYEAAKNYFRSHTASDHREWTVVDAARHLLNDLTINHDEQLLQEFFDAYYSPVAEKLYVYDDTIAVLARLKARYGTLGLISNTIFPSRAHLAELERFDIARYLSFTIFSSDFGFRKPHPAIFEHAASLAGVPPEDCVYIGDRYLEDIYGPSQIGMQAILKVTANREYPERLMPTIRCINTLSDLHQHLLF